MSSPSSVNRPSQADYLSIFHDLSGINEKNGFIQELTNRLGSPIGISTMLNAIESQLGSKEIGELLDLKDKMVTFLELPDNHLIISKIKTIYDSIFTKNKRKSPSSNSNANKMTRLSNPVGIALLEATEKAELSEAITGKILGIANALQLNGDKAENIKVFIDQIIELKDKFGEPILSTLELIVHHLADKEKAKNMISTIFDILMTPEAPPISRTTRSSENRIHITVPCNLHASAPHLIASMPSSAPDANSEMIRLFQSVPPHQLGGLLMEIATLARFLNDAEDVIDATNNLKSLPQQIKAEIFFLIEVATFRNPNKISPTDLHDAIFVLCKTLQTEEGYLSMPAQMRGQVIEFLADKPLSCSFAFLRIVEEDNFELLKAILNKPIFNNILAHTLAYELILILIKNSSDTLNERAYLVLEKIYVGTSCFDYEQENDLSYFQIFSVILNSWNEAKKEVIFTKSLKLIRKFKNFENKLQVIYSIFDRLKNLNHSRFSKLLDLITPLSKYFIDTNIDDNLTFIQTIFGKHRSNWEEIVKWLPPLLEIHKDKKMTPLLNQLKGMSEKKRGELLLKTITESNKGGSSTNEEKSTESSFYLRPAK